MIELETLAKIPLFYDVNSEALLETREGCSTAKK